VDVQSNTNPLADVAVEVVNLARGGITGFVAISEFYAIPSDIDLLIVDFGAYSWDGASCHVVTPPFFNPPSP
jgi:hypothetical protein